MSPTYFFLGTYFYLEIGKAILVFFKKKCREYIQLISHMLNNLCDWEVNVLKAFEIMAHLLVPIHVLNTAKF